MRPNYAHKIRPPGFVRGGFCRYVLFINLNFNVMNKTRRDEIQSMIDKIEELKTEVEQIKDDESDYYENMPENLQGGERGEQSYECVYNLESAVSYLDDAISSLQDTIDR